MTLSAKLRQALIAIVGRPWVKDDPVSLYCYRSDGLTLHTYPPLGVVFPGDTAELAQVVRTCLDCDVPFLPRGAGTGLSGGAVACEPALIIEMVRFDTVGPVDPINRRVTVGPGVVNLAVSRAAAAHGLRFVPDPSSQKACSIGGNVAENAGGPHTLKYGVTVNHVVGLEVVLATGEVMRCGGPGWGGAGPDLLALMHGSEGTFGIVTEVTCQLAPVPPSVVTMLGAFATVADASHTVSDIIAAGLVPAALEMVDQLVIEAVEQSLQVGFPTNAAAILIIELEDIAAGMDAAAAEIEAVCRRHGAISVERARDDTERALIWRARKEALGCLGNISPSFYTQDGVIPRSTLADVLTRSATMAKRHGLLLANVFHAGDGNLHPLILYDAQDPDQVDKALALGSEILDLCLEVGGTLSGEHGIGLEKSALMQQVYTAEDLAFMQQFRQVFNPHQRLNPGKIFPSPGTCSDTRLLRTKGSVQV